MTQFIKAPKMLDELLPVNTLGEKADLILVDERTPTPAEIARLRQAAEIYRNSLNVYIIDSK